MGRLLSQLQWWEAGLVMAAAFAILWLGAWALKTPRLTGGTRWAILAAIVIGILAAVAAFVLFLGEEL